MIQEQSNTYPDVNSEDFVSFKVVILYLLFGFCTYSTIKVVLELKRTLNAGITLNPLFSIHVCHHYIFIIVIIFLVNTIIISLSDI